MATEQEQYTPDSDDEMDTSGDEMDEIPVTLTPQEWKAKAGDLYKVGWCLPRSFEASFCVLPVCLPESISECLQRHHVAVVQGGGSRYASDLWLSSVLGVASSSPCGRAPTHKPRRRIHRRFDLNLSFIRGT